MAERALGLLGFVGAALGVEVAAATDQVCVCFDERNAVSGGAVGDAFSALAELAGRTGLTRVAGAAGALGVDFAVLLEGGRADLAVGEAGVARAGEAEGVGVGDALEGLGVGAAVVARRTGQAFTLVIARTQDEAALADQLRDEPPDRTEVLAARLAHPRGVRTVLARVALAALVGASPAVEPWSPSLPPYLADMCSTPRRPRRACPPGSSQPLPAAEAPPGPKILQ